MQVFRPGIAGMTGPLAKAGAVGDGLLACRSYVLVEGLCHHVKEQHEEVVDCAVSEMTKRRLSGSSLRHNRRHLRHKILNPQTYQRRGSQSLCLVGWEMESHDGEEQKLATTGTRRKASTPPPAADLQL